MGEEYSWNLERNQKKKHDKQKLDKQTVKQPVPTYVLWTSNIYLIQINKLPYGTFPYIRYMNADIFNIRTE